MTKCSRWPIQFGQLPLERGLVDLGRRRPVDAGRCGAAQALRHGAAGQRDAGGDLPRRQAADCNRRISRILRMDTLGCGMASLPGKRPERCRNRGPASDPHIGVAGIRRNGGRLARNPGRHGSESVADTDRNGWPVCVGISGRLGSEYAYEFAAQRVRRKTNRARLSITLRPDWLLYRRSVVGLRRLELFVAQPRILEQID